MNFDLSDEQQMVVDTVSKFVANESPVERFRNTDNARARSLGRMFRDTFSPQP